MAKKKQRRAAAAPRLRPEGAVESEKIHSISVDIRALPRAPIAGFASSCSVVEFSGFVEIRFLDPGSREAVFRAIVHDVNLVDNIIPSLGKFHDDCVRWLGDNGIAIEPVVEGGEPGLVKPVAASVWRIARTGLQAEIEMYYLPADELLKSSQGKRAECQVVAMVQLTLPVLSGLIMRLLARAASVGAPPELAAR